MLKGRVPGVEQLRLADMLVAAHCIGMKQHVADILGGARPEQLSVTCSLLQGRV